MIIEMHTGDLFIAEEIASVTTSNEDELTIYFKTRNDGIVYSFNNKAERDYVLKQIKAVLREKYEIKQIEAPPAATYFDWDIDDNKLTVWLYEEDYVTELTDATIQITNNADNIVTTMKSGETIELDYGDYTISAIVSTHYIAPEIKQIEMIPVSTYFDWNIDDNKLRVWLYELESCGTELTDATIQITDNANNIVTTMKSGEIVELDDGDYTISAMVSMHYIAPEIKQIFIKKPIHVKVEKRNSANNEVTFVFKNAETNDFIKNLLVTVSCSDVNYCRYFDTDSNGCIKFVDLQNGKYRIELSPNFRFFNEADSTFQVNNVKNKGFWHKRS